MSGQWWKKPVPGFQVTEIAHAVSGIDWRVRGALLGSYNDLYRPLRVNVVSGMYMQGDMVYGLVAIVECKRPVLEPPFSIRWSGTVGAAESPDIIRFAFGYPRAELSVSGGELTLRDLELIQLAAEKLEPLARGRNR